MNHLVRLQDWMSGPLVIFCTESFVIRIATVMFAPLYWLIAMIWWIITLPFYIISTEV